MEFNTEHLDLSIQFELDVVRWEGKIQSLSNSEIVASFPSSFRPLELGTVIGKAHIFNGGLMVDIQNLVVKHIETTSEENPVQFHVEEQSSKALLWSLVYELKNGDDNPIQVHDSTPRAQKIPYRGHYTIEKFQERITWLKNTTGKDLRSLNKINIDPSILKGNIENFIGTVEVPIGLAGPLLFNGQHVQGYCYAPFATTEGSLVASACRGTKAINRAGGVNVHVIRQQMIRAPVFMTQSMKNAITLQSWIMDHEEEIKFQASLVSSHGMLKAIEPFLEGKSLYLRFIYETGDAAGQNLTTACTWKACQWILEQMKLYPDIKIDHFMIESNLSGDKKVNYLSYISSRGICVSAEASIPDEVMEDVLKVSPDLMVRAAQTFMGGSIKTGMLGFNIDVANVIAAIFTSTGQDIACVHESSTGQLNIQREEKGVYVSILLPSLIIGTVGGGTGLPSQIDCLKIMDCHGAGKVNRLAEIIAGYCLALDISTLSAIANGQFAAAHEKLGRNRPEDGLKEEHLTNSFFEEVLNGSIQDGKGVQVKVTEYKPLLLDNSASILSDLTATNLKKKVGHFLYEIHWEKNGKKGKTKVVLKVKPTDIEIVNMLNSMAQACGQPLSSLYAEHKFGTGFRKCHTREIGIYQMSDPWFTAITPRIFHTWRDDENEIFVIAMEYLENMSHLNSVHDIRIWEKPFIKDVLKDIAKFHGLYLGNIQEVIKKEWIDFPTSATMSQMAPLWEELIHYNALEFPKLYTKSRVKILYRLLSHILNIWIGIENSPRTLIHNDFNPRNICLRKVRNGHRLCVYDWELSTIHAPQRDICEFLAFVLPPGTENRIRKNYVDYYRKELEKSSGRVLNAMEFLEVYNLCCYDFALTRLGLYTMAHSFKEYEFLPRVLDSHFEYLDSIPRLKF